MGSASVKIYDKFKRVLRIETTTNDVSFFKHHRKVEHRDGSITRELAPLKKSIYSIIDLREILLGCNSRYLEFLSSLDDYSDGHRALQQLTKPKTDHGVRVRGFNFFDATEQDLLLAIQRPEFNIHGLRRSRSEETSSICFKRKTFQIPQTSAHSWVDHVTHQMSFLITLVIRNDTLCVQVGSLPLRLV